MTTNLTSHLYAVLSGSALTEPRAIADELQRRIPRTERSSALTEALVAWVRVALSQRRMLPPQAIMGDPSGQTTSAKVARVRHDWQARLQTPLLVGDTWKRLADCDAVDLRMVAHDLRARASQLVSKADWYEALADAVTEQGPGATVAALPGDPTEAVAA
jgi:hypothetical protein